MVAAALALAFTAVGAGSASTAAAQALPSADVHRSPVRSAPWMPGIKPAPVPTSKPTPNARPTAPIAPRSTTSGFITRSGTTLMLDGRPFRYVGFNAMGMSGCETGTAWTRTQLDDYFSRLSPDSVTRTWAFAPYGTAALDQIVASAQAHNQKIMFVLADGRSYCGEHDGAVAGDGSGKTDSWYRSGFRVRYLPWVRTVVARYATSPAVGMWELINEPGGTGALSDATMRAFFDETATVVKSIDRNHLVASGAQAEYMNGTRDYAYVHGGANIDVGTLHEYDYDYGGSNVIVSGHLAPTLAAMRAINKPLLVDEVGVESGAAGCRTSLTARVGVMQQKFAAYVNVGVAGVNVWGIVAGSYGGCEYDVRVNDPLVAAVRVTNDALRSPEIHPPIRRPPLTSGRTATARVG